VISDDLNVEDGVVRPAASPRRLSKGLDERIIFPYAYVEGQLKRYSVEEFKKSFPKAFDYLKDNMSALKKRKSDGKWFEYGRSQALYALNTKKLLLSTIVTQKIKIYELAQDCIPYAGIFVKQKTCDYSLKDAIDILTSQQFIDYAYNVGININGTSVRITVKDIMNYYF